MIINRKIIRSFRENKSRYVGLAVLIIISCMLFTGFQTSAPNALEQIEKFFKETNVEDANFTLHSPLTNIDELETTFNVEIEEVKQVDYPFNTSSTMRIFQDPTKVNKYSVINGRGLINNKEIVVDKKFAIANDIQLNSTIQINGITFEVVGLVTKPDYIYTLKSPSDLMNNPNSFGFAIISQGDFSNLEYYTINYSIVFQENNQGELRDYLNENHTILYWLDRDNNSRISAVVPDLRAKIPIGTFIPIFIFITTCLIISVVLWRLLKTEFTQIGTLYAIGYKRVDILKHYLVYPVVLCLVGGTVGTLLGMLISEHIIYVTDGVQYNFPLMDISFNPIIILLSFILPFVFLVPTTTIVVGKALSYSPLELMRGAGNKTKISLLEKRLKLNHFSFNTKFRIREIARNIPRNLVMIIGIGFASSLLLLGFIMNDSIRSIVEDGYDDLYKFNYQYVMRGLQTQTYDNAERQSFVPAFAYDNLGEEVSFTIYGIEQNTTLINLTDSSGKKLDTSKVIINKPLSEKLNIREGDTIKIYNKINDKVVEITVERIASHYLGHTLHLPIDQFNQVFDFPEGSYTMLLSKVPLNLDPNIIASTMTEDELRQAYENILQSIRILIIIIGVIASLIGLIIIYILTSLVIEENKANISLMKILGYGRKKISSLVINSNVIFVILGFIISIPFTVSMTDKLFVEIAEDMNLTVPAIIRISSLALSFFIMFITYYLSNLMIKKKVMQISMADSLKNREE